METILKLDLIKKSFGKTQAVAGVSFEVKKGQCFGLLGPNGAGKSTTIEMIEGIQKPDSGKVFFRGQDIRESSSYLERLGVQFQTTALPPSLKVKESLEIFSKLYEKTVPISRLVELCQLEEFLNQFHNKISGGQRQRLLLALALCNDPDLLLLDEPTTGLDPQARRNVWDIVNMVKAKGKTVLLTTHYMDEAEQLCDEIAIMDHGKIIAQGQPRDLLRTHFDTTVMALPFEGVIEFSQNEIECLGEIHLQHGILTIRTKDIPHATRFLIQKGISLTGLEIRQSNLEDLFIVLTGKGLRG